MKGIGAKMSLNPKEILSLANNVANLKDISELHDLVIHLRGIILELQSSNLELLTNSRSLLEEISELKKERENIIKKSSFPEDLIFRQNLGIWHSASTGFYYCSSCKNDGVVSLLSVSDSSWHCEIKSCDKYYHNPHWRPAAENSQARIW